MIETERLRLVSSLQAHSAAFAAMHADPEVMADLGGPISAAESKAKLYRYQSAWEECGVSRWAVEDGEGQFLGYAGVMLRPDQAHPLGRHFEIGWRFIKEAWGRGFATESARAALADAFDRVETEEILSYTGVENNRSRAVMARLGLQRASSRDFTAEYTNVGPWHGLVWAASRVTT